MTFILDHATIIGLLFFFSVFIGIAIWAYHPRTKKKLESYAKIPLEDNNGQQE